MAKYLLWNQGFLEHTLGNANLVYVLLNSSYVFQSRLSDWIVKCEM